MPSFKTPEPISVTAEVYAGSIQFTASDRRDTVIEVHARDPKRELDVRTAEQTEIALAGGALTVRTPKLRSVMLGRSGAVDVTVDLPAGSRVEVSGSWTRVTGTGVLGETRVKSSGDVGLDTTGPLFLTVSHGSVAVTRVNGPAEVSTGSGSQRIGLVDGSAVLKATHGATTVGAVTGDLRASAATGDIEVARTDASVHASTAHGNLRFAEVGPGTVQLESSNGSIEIGVRDGAPAWLDVSSGSGQIRNTLDPAAAPQDGSAAVRIHARTRHGNIDIHRA